MRLIEALEAAPAAVVAVVAEPRQVDAHGYAARLSVESALAGRVPAGAELRIGWEELATSRAPRFADGERVLLALEPLPGDSIWATRFPDPVLRSRVFGVSMRGDAFLRAPSPRAVERLEHYLKLAARDREGASGVALLAELAADTEPPLAVGAAERLARNSGLESTLDPAAAALVVRALQRTDAGPALSAALLEMIARERPPALRAPLEALASREPLAPAVVFEALAALDSGVAPARTARLLRGASPCASGGRGAACERPDRAGGAGAPGAERSRARRCAPRRSSAWWRSAAPRPSKTASQRCTTRSPPYAARPPARSARSAGAPSADCGGRWIRATRTRRAPP